MAPQAPGGYGMDPQVMNWFRSVDVDNSGRITSVELQQALTNADWSSFSSEACKLMINLFDRSGNGTIGIQEFQSLWRYIQDWQNTFNRYDNNRSGFIEHHELEQALQSMGYRLSPAFISIVIAKYDQKNRRHISTDNFIVTCIKLHLFTESFRSKDVQGMGQIKLSYEDLLTMFVATL